MDISRNKVRTTEKCRVLIITALWNFSLFVLQIFYQLFSCPKVKLDHWRESFLTHDIYTSQPRDIKYCSIPYIVLLLVRFWLDFYGLLIAIFRSVGAIFAMWRNKKSNLCPNYFLNLCCMFVNSKYFNFLSYSRFSFCGKFMYSGISIKRKHYKADTSIRRTLWRERKLCFAVKLS